MKNNRNEKPFNSKKSSKTSKIERLLAAIFAPRAFKNSERNSNSNVPNEYLYLVYRL